MNEDQGLVAPWEEPLIVITQNRTNYERDEREDARGRPT